MKMSCSKEQKNIKRVLLNFHKLGYLCSVFVCLLNRIFIYSTWLLIDRVIIPFYSIKTTSPHNPFILSKHVCLWWGGGGFRHFYSHNFCAEFSFFIFLCFPLSLNLLSLSFSVSMSLSLSLSLSLSPSLSLSLSLFAWTNKLDQNVSLFNQ